MVACYHPPKCSKEWSKTLFEEIAGFINKNKKYPVWIGGNFNLPDTNWETRSVISHQYSKDINDKCLEVIHDCYLEQLATFPTWGRNALDLMLTPGFADNNSTIFSDMQCHPQLPKPLLQKIFN